MVLYIYAKLLLQCNGGGGGGGGIPPHHKKKTIITLIYLIFKICIKQITLLIWMAVESGEKHTF